MNPKPIAILLLQSTAAIAILLTPLQSSAAFDCSRILLAAKIAGIAAWEIGGIPLRMMIAKMVKGDNPDDINFAVTGRGALNYAIRLQLTDRDLRNKRIVDLGSGMSFFVNEVNVIYGSTGTRAIAVDRFVSAGRPAQTFTQADMRDLPFEDRSFDLTLSVWSMTYFAQQRQRESLEKALAEAIRVTDKGGEVRIAYEWGGAGDEFERALQRLNIDRKFEYRIGRINPLFLVTASGLIKIKVLD